MKNKKNTWKHEKLTWNIGKPLNQPGILENHKKTHLEPWKTDLEL